MSVRGRKKAARVEDEEDLEQEQEEEEEQSAPKSRRKTPARGAAKGSAGRGRGKRGSAAPEATPREVTSKKKTAEKAHELQPAPATCKKDDAPKLFLQSFLGAPAKKLSEVGEVVERINGLCGASYALAECVEAANQRLEEGGLDVALRRTADEREGVVFWVLANSKACYASQQLGLPLARPEREYLERILEEIARDGAGRVAVGECGLAPLKVAKLQQWQAVLERLVALQLLQYAGLAVGGGPQWVLLGVRALVELGAHLAAASPAPPPDCHFCKMPAFHRSTCSACALACHVHCEKGWLGSGAGATKCCPSCKAFWKPREPAPRPPLRRARVEREEEEAVKIEGGDEEEEDMVEEEPQQVLSGRESSFIDIIN